MYKELSVLPKQNEQFSKDEIATTVMYVGHKPTTRREQIQQNWSIEVKKIKTSAPNNKNSKNKLQDKKKTLLLMMTPMMKFLCAVARVTSKTSDNNVAHVAGSVS